ncbi:MAG: hypothetical protein E6J97_05880 [Methanobacteriota archaeon]|nr:MAG: hypothetical protein E6J97_05880 [Euryarchaeota archaeon]
MVVYVMITAGLVFVLQAHPAAAVAGSKDTLTVGLQNDMVNPNYFDTATNSVWKQYHVEFNFEGLFSHDPDFGRLVPPAVSRAAQDIALIQRASV